MSHEVGGRDYVPVRIPRKGPYFSQPPFLLLKKPQTLISVDGRRRLRDLATQQALEEQGTSKRLCHAQVMP